MKYAVLVVMGALLCAVPANAMDVETFFAKAVTLQKKGLGSVFAKDLKPMIRVIEEAAKLVKAESETARAAGLPLFCAPKKYPLNAEQFIGEFSRNPKERRQLQSVRDAWREIVIRRFPC
ncbi:hypothetical protein [Sphingorhabdus sp. EL138]|uniref:hypothetical protein n=1 Tax=Sphingorhabdus sp. EL138 TaxID=2073156 RepID=UPI0025F75DE5|nr:hypothetical protein [Sphingorhabdus sp. EL138]